MRHTCERCGRPTDRFTRADAVTRKITLEVIVPYASLQTVTHTIWTSEHPDEGWRAILPDEGPTRAECTLLTLACIQLLHAIAHRQRELEQNPQEAVP